MAMSYKVADGCFLSRLNNLKAPDGVIPNQEQLDIARLLFRDGDRHFTKEDLHTEALLLELPFGIAEIDNALQVFTKAGWIRKLSVDAEDTVFDTNTSKHHHFHVADSDEIIDIQNWNIPREHLPEPPAGMEIANIEVIVSVRSKSN